MGGIVASSNCTSTAGPAIWITFPMFSAIISFVCLRAGALCGYGHILRHGGRQRDNLAVSAHRFDVSGNRFSDVALGLLKRVSNGDAARQVGNVRAVTVRRSLEDNRVFEILSHFNPA